MKKTWKALFIFSLSTFISFHGYCQSATALQYAKTITVQDLKRHLSVLAADSLEGRETGMIGQKKAANYIRSQFKKIGLTPAVVTDGKADYFQPFELIREAWGEVYIKTPTDSLLFKKDFFTYPKFNVAQLQNFTLNYVTNDAIINDKMSGQAIVTFYKEENAEKITQEAAKNKVELLCFVLSQEAFDKTLEKDKRNIDKGYLQVKTADSLASSPKIFYLSPRGFSKLNVQGTPEPSFLGRFISVKAQRITKKHIKSENVAGFIEGTDKKDEIIVITAHYDHVGIKNGKIHNGADDDASGTSAVIEMAEAFAKAKKDNKGPRRSILFMTVAGEEIGLFGSQYYTDYSPLFPLKNTVVNLNIDMIGRLDEKYKANQDYIYVIGSDKLSKDLHQLSEKAKKTYMPKMTFDYTYNDENDPNRYYYRSDHYNFAKNNIPIIFYFNGVHEDYHQPTDDIEKIIFPKVEKITQIIFLTAWEIANREERIKVDKEKIDIKEK